MPDALVSLDPALFRAWLAAHGEAEKVGVSGVSGMCPLACWVAERTQEPVDVTMYGVWVSERRQSAPLWSWWFMERIDQLVPAYVDVSAGQALEVLDAVLAECERVEAGVCRRIVLSDAGA